MYDNLSTCPDRLLHIAKGERNLQPFPSGWQKHVFQPAFSVFSPTAIGLTLKGHPSLIISRVLYFHCIIHFYYFIKILQYVAYMMQQTYLPRIQGVTISYQNDDDLASKALALTLTRQCLAFSIPQTLLEDLGQAVRVAIHVASLSRHLLASCHQQPYASTVKGMQTQPKRLHFSSFVACLRSSAAAVADRVITLASFKVE